MVIEAGAFIVYRPPRRSLLSVTTELSYLSHSFCRSLRPIARRKLIAGAIQAITLSDAQQRPSRQQAQTSRRVHGGSCRMSVESRARAVERITAAERARARRTLRRDGVTFHIQRAQINDAGAVSGGAWFALLGRPRRYATVDVAVSRNRDRCIRPVRQRGGRVVDRTSQSCRPLTATALDEHRARWPWRHRLLQPLT